MTNDGTRVQEKRGLRQLYCLGGISIWSTATELHASTMSNNLKWNDATLNCGNGDFARSQVGLRLTICLLFIVDKYTGDCCYVRLLSSETVVK